MTYNVIITPRATTDFRTIYRYIDTHAPQAAREWMQSAERAAYSLARLPERCTLAPESRSFGKPIRQLLFGGGNRGTYRLLFVVIDESVYVLHVRHGSRLPLDPEE